LNARFSAMHEPRGVHVTRSQGSDLRSQDLQGSGCRRSPASATPTPHLTSRSHQRSSTSDQPQRPAERFRPMGAEVGGRLADGAMRRGPADRAAHGGRYQDLSADLRHTRVRSGDGERAAPRTGLVLSALPERTGARTVRWLR